jgi:hypothetical protein
MRNALLAVVLGLVACGAAGGCRQGSRRDGVVTSSSSPSPSASASGSAAAASATTDASATDAGTSGADVDAALPPGTVAYGPATLVGKLTEETFFGPPGFGADKEHDKKEPVLVLQLAQPIDVVRPPEGGSELDVDRMAVTKVSLTDPKDAGVDLRKLVGLRITVKGTLFGAHTAHHHTDVLMSGVEVVPE